MPNEHFVKQFMEELSTQTSLSKNTLSAYKSDIQQFHLWLNQLPLIDVLSAEKKHINEYLEFCTNKGYAARTAVRILSVLKKYYKWMTIEGHVNENPVSDIKPPVVEKVLPTLLSVEQIKSLLDAPNVNTPIGLRDKTILEFLHKTGLRVSEMIDLRLDQIDLEEGILKVNAKTGFSRVLPLTGETIVYLKSYMEKIRPFMATGKPDSDYLFITQRGSGMTRQACWYIIKRYAKHAGITESISPHTLRHSFAANLLQQGKNLQDLKSILGHSDLSTTQMYKSLALEIKDAS